MIDWHSHILPKMDDGSKSTEESLTLLRMLSEQGVNTVMATPHFYANDDSVDSFLARRQHAYDRLMAALPAEHPNIFIGAEVRYYQGISRMNDLERLRNEGSKVLLLEMHEVRWTEYVLRELMELSGAGDFTLMLAHAERCLPMQPLNVHRQLLELGIMIQVNAGVFLSMGTRRKALKYLKQGGVLFLGSDCHNTSSRPPRIGEALAVIDKKIGAEPISKIRHYGRAMLR